MRNLRSGFRQLARQPLITTVAVASLALGLGANVAVYSLLSQVLLRELPVPEADRLVNFSSPGPKPGSVACGIIGGCEEAFSFPMYQDLKREQGVFTDIAAHAAFGANLATGGQTRSADGLYVSGSYFPVLQLQPALGRLIGPDDANRPGAGRVVVLSHEYWQSAYGGDPGVLQRPIIVNGQSLEIIGVAAREFRGTTLGLQPSVFVPISLHGVLEPGWDDFGSRRSYWAYLFARLKPGVSMAEAAAALAPRYRGVLETTEAPLQRGLSPQQLSEFTAKPLLLLAGAHGQSTLRTDTATPLRILFGISVLVVLIVCANVSNLLLARGAARSGEIAVRAAMGGTRLQLVRQLLVEALVLGCTGGVLGLAIAVVSLRAMTSLLPAALASSISPRLDADAFLFMGALSLGSTALFGLFPALQSTRRDLITTIRAQAGGRTAGGHRAGQWRSGLAVAQVALAMALLSSAGLFLRSLVKLSRIDLGLATDGLVTFRISPERNGYQAATAQQLYQRLQERLVALPGVRAATASSVSILTGDRWGSLVNVEGYRGAPDEEQKARYNHVGAGYFTTLQIPLVAGREFTPGDQLGTPKVVVINEAFARRFKLGDRPVGRRIDMGSGRLDLEIVGVVRDAKYDAVKTEVPALFFLPYAQVEQVGSLAYYVRGDGDPASLMPAIAAAMRQLDPNLPVVGMRTMQDQLNEHLFLDRFVSLLSLLFALVATILAAIGLYGVIAYTVAQRTREFGVRSALGATPARIRALVMRQVSRMTLAGGVVGILAAVAIGRISASLLYGVVSPDPVVLLGAGTVLALVALGAGFLPARRAAALDPIRAIRSE